MNYGLVRIRLDVAHTIITGLQRLEYRGYDSAGIALDGKDNEISIFKEVGPVANLLSLVNEQLEDPVRFPSSSLLPPLSMPSLTDHCSSF